MNHPVRLVAFRIHTQSVRIVFALEFDDFTAVIPDNFTAGHDVTTAQANRLIRRQTLPLAGRLLDEIFTVNIKCLAPGHFPLPHVRVLRVNRQHQGLRLVCRIIGQGDLQRAHHTHGAGRPGVEILTDGMFQHAHIHGTAGLVDTDHIAERADGFRCVTATTHTGNGRHARVVPAVHEALIHQALELALGGDCVVEVQPGEFNLSWLARGGNVLQHPVVERPMILEFQRAQGVSNTLHGIGNRVGEVIHRVDAPLVTGLVMVCVADTVKNRIPQVDIGRGHINLGPQHQLTVLVFAITHITEQLETFFYRAIPIRAVPARSLQGTTELRHLVCCQRTDIGLALCNQLFGEVIDGIEVIRGVTDVTAPGVAQPLYILLDGINVLLGFLLGVGIIKTQVALTTKSLGNTKVQANGLGMPNVQVAIRLWREPRHYLAGVFAFGNRVFDQALNKVMGFLRLGAHRFSS